MVDVPNRTASRRMVRASAPSASTSEMASSTIRSRLSGGAGTGHGTSLHSEGTRQLVRCTLQSYAVRKGLAVADTDVPTVQDPDVNDVDRIVALYEARDLE